MKLAPRLTREGVEKLIEGIRKRTEWLCLKCFVWTFNPATHKCKEIK